MLDELIRRGDVLDILMKYPNTPKGVFEAVRELAPQTLSQLPAAMGGVEVPAPGSDGWTSAYISPLCADCANLEEDTLRCRMSGETAERERCLDWFPRGVEKE